MASPVVQVASLAFLAAVLALAGALVGQLPANGGGGRGPADTFLRQPKEAAGPDFRPEVLTDDLVERLRAAVAAEASRPIASLGAQNGLAAHVGEAAELQAASAEAVAALEEAFEPSGHWKLHKALQALGLASANVHAALLEVAQPASERLALETAAAAGGPSQVASSAGSARRPGQVSLRVTVSELPFGMHIEQGTTRVEEVFPGFPARKTGVRRGCELEHVGGAAVNAGTWLEVFQRSTPPFSLHLRCSSASAASAPSGGGAVAAVAAGGSSVIEGGGRYRVMVTKKPYGMNIQVNKVPRVVEVLPGFPAEAAGVLRGFVLRAVGDRPVDASNWFEEYQSAKLPFTLTFDTKVPVHAGNPFFAASEQQTAPGVVVASLERAEDEEAAPGVGFDDVRCTVEALPFGMHVQAPPGRRPRVVGVLKGSPADRSGVHVGDVLLEVAGRGVTSSTWFSSMQQARVPYGLFFKRPVGGDDNGVPPYE